MEAPVGSTDIYVQDATFLSFPHSFITDYKLDNVANIQKVTQPLLWLHGLEDDRNRWDTHGLAVYNHHGGTIKYQKLVPGADHSEIPSTLSEDFSVYIQGVKDFIEGREPF